MCALNSLAQQHPRGAVGTVSGCEKNVRKISGDLATNIILFCWSQGRTPSIKIYLPTYLNLSLYPVEGKSSRFKLGGTIDCKDKIGFNRVPH